MVECLDAGSSVIIPSSITALGRQRYISSNYRGYCRSVLWSSEDIKEKALTYLDNELRSIYYEWGEKTLLKEMYKRV